MMIPTTLLKMLDMTVCALTSFSDRPPTYFLFEKKKSKIPIKLHHLFRGITGKILMGFWNDYKQMWIHNLHDSKTDLWIINIQNKIEMI